MSLSGVFFVFLFFPSSILLYRLIPEKWRNSLLLALSLIFISFGNPADLILIGLSTVFNYFTALEIDGLRSMKREKTKKLVLATGIAVNTALLIFYKYFVFLMSNIGLNVNFGIPAAPVGLSFFTFSAISCLCDVSKGDETPLKNPFDFALFISFFGKLSSGPIVKYRDMARQIKDRTMTATSVESGMKLFLIGLGKKLIISGSLGKFFNAFRTQDISTMSTVTAWLGALFYSLMLYYDFSGYSDMAIGIGRIFGFSFSKNFDHPFISSSMTDFWRRWHISLGAWFRDYIYIPMGGSRVSKSRHILNLSVVWLLTGLWHGANWTFVVWGLYHLVLLLLEKMVFKKILKRIPTIIKTILTFLLTVIGWTIFFSDSLSTAEAYLLRMFGLGGSGLVDSMGKYYLASGGILLFVAMIGATPLLSAIGSKIEKRDSVLVKVSTAVFFALLLLISTAFMISETVSSFLYAQF